MSADTEIEDGELETDADREATREFQEHHEQKLREQEAEGPIDSATEPFVRALLKR